MKSPALTLDSRINRIYWRHRFGRISTQTAGRHYQRILNELTRLKLKADQQFIDSPNDSAVRNNIIQLDNHIMAALQTLNRNDLIATRCNIRHAYARILRFKLFSRGEHSLKTLQAAIQKTIASTHKSAQNPTQNQVLITSLSKRTATLLRKDGQPRKAIVLARITHQLLESGLPQTQIHTQHIENPNPSTTHTNQQTLKQHVDQLHQQLQHLNQQISTQFPAPTTPHQPEEPHS